MKNFIIKWEYFAKITQKIMLEILANVQINVPLAKILYLFEGFQTILIGHKWPEIALTVVDKHQLVMEVKYI